MVNTTLKRNKIFIHCIVLDEVTQIKITLTSLSGCIAKPQQVTHTPGIRFGIVLLTKQLTLKQISQPYIFSHLDF